jgi:hypothetical protein
MSPNRAVFFTVSAITLSLLINSTHATPALASSKGRGSVTQEQQVSTGNSNLDKEINKFYSCISKTHQDPPSIAKVDKCYLQTLGGSDTGGGTSPSDSGLRGVDTIPTTTSPHHQNK